MLLNIGVDEVGRGAGSGPLVACAFVFFHKIDIAVRDSKQLSPDRRNNLFRQLNSLRADNKVDWSVISINNNIIDQYGIQLANISAIRISTSKLIERLLSSNLNDFEIIADGSLKLPPIVVHNKEYRFRSIIKADRDYPSVSAASIIAKVIRDKYMDMLHSQHPEYSWNENKGYLTAKHVDAIKKHGISPLHRAFFCNNFCVSRIF